MLSVKTKDGEDITISDEERQPCEVWTRVMGYYRPVSFFNVGKKREYADRKCFSEDKIDGIKGE